MSEIMAEIANDMSVKLGKALDGLISEGIARALGTSEWSIDKLNGRLDLHRFIDRPEEIYLLDGVPFLELHPFQHGFDTESGSFKCKWTRQYRFLGPDNLSNDSEWRDAVGKLWDNFKESPNNPTQ